MFQVKGVEKIETHVLCSVTSFRKSFRLLKKSGKILYSGAGHNDNMAHCMLHTKGYKHTHTHSGCVILIAFTPQQWLHERAPT